MQTQKTLNPNYLHQTCRKEDETNGLFLCFECHETRYPVLVQSSGRPVSTKTPIIHQKTKGTLQKPPKSRSLKKSSSRASDLPKKGRNSKAIGVSYQPKTAFHKEQEKLELERLIELEKQQKKQRLRDAYDRRHAKRKKHLFQTHPKHLSVSATRDSKGKGPARSPPLSNKSKQSSVLKESQTSDLETMTLQVIECCDVDYDIAAQALRLADFDKERAVNNLLDTSKDSVRLATELPNIPDDNNEQVASAAGHAYDSQTEEHASPESSSAPPSPPPYPKPSEDLPRVDPHDDTYMLVNPVEQLAHPPVLQELRYDLDSGTIAIDHSTFKNDLQWPEDPRQLGIKFNLPSNKWRAQSAKRLLRSYPSSYMNIGLLQYKETEWTVHLSSKNTKLFGSNKLAFDKVYEIFRTELERVSKVKSHHLDVSGVEELNGLRAGQLLTVLMRKWSLLPYGELKLILMQRGKSKSSQSLKLSLFQKQLIQVSELIQIFPNSKADVECAVEIHHQQKTEALLLFKPAEVVKLWREYFTPDLKTSGSHSFELYSSLLCQSLITLHNPRIGQVYCPLLKSLGRGAVNTVHVTDDTLAFKAILPQIADMRLENINKTELLQTYCSKLSQMSELVSLKNEFEQDQTCSRFELMFTLESNSSNMYNGVTELLSRFDGFSKFLQDQSDLSEYFYLIHHSQVQQRLIDLRKIFIHPVIEIRQQSELLTPAQRNFALICLYVYRLAHGVRAQYGSSLLTKELHLLSFLKRLLNPRLNQLGCESKTLQLSENWHWSKRECVVQSTKPVSELIKLATLHDSHRGNLYRGWRYERVARILLWDEVQLFYQRLKRSKDPWAAVVSALLHWLRCALYRASTQCIGSLTVDQVAELPLTLEGLRKLDYGDSRVNWQKHLRGHTNLRRWFLEYAWLGAGLSELIHETLKQDGNLLCPYMYWFLHLVLEDNGCDILPYPQVTPTGHSLVRLDFEGSARTGMVADLPCKWNDWKKLPNLTSKVSYSILATLLFKYCAGVQLSYAVQSVVCGIIYPLNGVTYLLASRHSLLDIWNYISKHFTREEIEPFIDPLIEFLVYIRLVLLQHPWRQKSQILSGLEQFSQMAYFDTKLYPLLSKFPNCTFLCAAPFPPFEADPPAKVEPRKSHSVVNNRTTEAWQRSSALRKSLRAVGPCDAVTNELHSLYEDFDHLILKEDPEEVTQKAGLKLLPEKKTQVPAVKRRRRKRRRTRY